MFKLPKEETISILTREQNLESAKAYTVKNDFTKLLKESAKKLSPMKIKLSFKGDTEIYLNVSLDKDALGISELKYELAEDNDFNIIDRDDIKKWLLISNIKIYDSTIEKLIRESNLNILDYEFGKKNGIFIPKGTYGSKKDFLFVPLIYWHSVYFDATKDLLISMYSFNSVTNEWVFYCNTPSLFLNLKIEKIINI